jgi:hypothetical protein
VAFNPRGVGGRGGGGGAAVVRGVAVNVLGVARDVVHFSV